MSTPLLSPLFLEGPLRQTYKLEPKFTVANENEVKKNKLKSVLQPTLEGGKVKGPEVVSMRMDGLKSGVLKHF